MKQVNFSNSGGFPLEQETLDRLQTAYRSELYEALKAHLSIEPGTNYIIAPPTTEKVGWVIVHEKAYIPKDSGKPVATIEKKEGILYPVAKKEDKDKAYTYIKTTRTGTNLVYGTGTSKTAYFDYEAQYLTSEMYNSADKTVPNTDALTVNYYLLDNFEIVKDINGILNTIDDKVRELKTTLENSIGNVKTTLESSIGNVKTTLENSIGSVKTTLESNIGNVKTTLENSIGNVKTTLESSIGSVKTTLESSIGSVKTNLESSIGAVKDSCLHINGDNAMLGDLTLKSVDQNTEIKDTAGNITSFKYDSSLLLIDNQGKVIKSEEKFDELIKRIAKLEKDKTSAIPIGMIAIWGKSAPFPEGWEEYVPLRGKMPVGLYNPTPEEIKEEVDGNDDDGFNITYFKDYYGNPLFPFTNLNNSGGQIGKQIYPHEMPRHTHDYNDIFFSEKWGPIPVTGGIGSQSTDSDNGGFQIKRTTETSGESKSFSILNPYKVVYFIEYTGRPSDKTAPTPPSNLAVSSIGTTSVSLNWSAATDEFGVTDYIVYGDGILPNSVGNFLNHTIYGLAPGTKYSFSVKAKDAAGNVSADSNIVTVTTTIPPSDTTPPETPLITSTLYNHLLRINLSWLIPYDNVGVTEYELWRSEDYNDFVLISTQPSTVYADFNIYYGSSYYYKVRARDAAGNWSNFSKTTSATPIDLSSQCFDVESLVTMASGQSKKLKNVVIGDQLQGFSFPNEVDESEGDYLAWRGKLNEASKAAVTVVNKKTALVDNYYEITAHDGTVIKVTGEHSLLTTQDGVNVQWVRTKNVVNSMSLIDKTGKIKTIESIIFKEEPLEVAVLDVESVDNYVIAGIVAHNAPIRDEVIAK